MIEILAGFGNKYNTPTAFGVLSDAPYYLSIKNFN